MGKTETNQNDGMTEKIQPVQSRRSFLKRAAIGIATVPPMMGVKLLIQEGTERATGYHTGNAGTIESNDCKNNPTSEPCQDEKNSIPDYNSNEVVFHSSVTVPLVEEIIFRDIPSTVFFKKIDRKNREENRPFTYKMSRREVIVGAGTSVAFGAVHNIEGTSSFNTEVIPAPQVVGGGAYWYLQRKFGLISNFAAHGTHNFIISMILRKTS